MVLPHAGLFCVVWSDWGAGIVFVG
ncbi:MAG: hypothetical protein ACQKBT_04715, partial [Puniceicoccales bacterium]